MSEPLDVRALTEDLTVQQVILDSLQGEHFDNIEEERREARLEIERIKALLDKAQRDARHTNHESETQGTPPATAAMATSRASNDIWSSPASTPIPNRKRNYSTLNTDRFNMANKSRRTTPTPAAVSSGFPISQPRLDSDFIDIIDLTRDDIEADSAVVAEQMRELERRSQENRDRAMALRLSSQERHSPPSAESSSQNAFSKLMASQRSNSASGLTHDEGSTSLMHIPHATPPSHLPYDSMTMPIPGSYNSAWDDPFQSHPVNHAPNPYQPSHHTPALTVPLPFVGTTGYPSSMPGSVAGRAGGPWGSPYPQPSMPSSSTATPIQGFGTPPNGLPWPRPGVQATPSSKSALSDIINRTSAFDYSTGLDAYGNPLPDRVASFIQDAIYDPRVTEQELDDLLKNIRPDMEISEKNRDGTPAGLKSALYPHQELALTWMKKMEDGTNKGGILADDMGLGKTISTLALILDRPATSRPKTNLIIGPLSLVRQWEEEIKVKTKLSHRLSVFVYHNKKATTDDLLKFDVVLTTYGTIAQELKRLDKYMADNIDRNIDYDDKAFALKCPLLHPKKAIFHRIILDEAQCIKNKETQTAKACCKLRATYRWCLTGTPMMNGVLELYSLLNFLRIKPYCSWDRFRSSFGQLFGRKGDPKSVAMNRLRALLKAVMLRRKKDSKLDGKPILRLPEKSEEVVYAQLSEEERDFYNQLEKKSQVQFSKYLREGTIGKNYSNILVLLLRLRQACCHPHLNLDLEDASVVNEDMLEIVRTLDPATIQRIKAIEAFECPICQDAVQCPSFFVPCGHDSCKQCLVRIVDDATATNLREGNESDKAKCPMCRGLFDPKKCFTYDAFQKVHMPEMVAEEETKNEDTDDDGDTSDSQSDDELAYASDDDVDGKGNLKNFIVYDDEDDEADVDEKKPAKQKCTENSSDVAPETMSTTCSSKKKKKKKGKKKQSDVKPLMLKSLRQEAHKNREAFKRYMRYLRKTWMPAAKVSQCMELLKTIEETGEKTIIFSQWTLLLDLLEVAMHHDKLGKPERYDGSMSGEQRNEAAKKFREKPGVKVMLVSLRAGNAGLNLTAASRVIIMDPFWNPYIEMQAVDRAYRIGQPRPVKVYRILTQQTVEDRIVELQDRKKEIVEAALDEKESMKIGRLNVSELKFLFNTRD